MPSALPERGQEPTGDWAICCSGGGIRSATYCLGVLQSLDESGLLGRAKWIVGVSGGSFIAASRALVAEGLHRTEEKRRSKEGHRAQETRRAYARGTPEEDNLRNDTRYREPHRATALAGALAVLLGTMVTFVLAVAPLYMVAHAWGWLLRWRGVLVPSGPRAMTAASTGLAWWLPSMVAAGIMVALLVFWRASLKSSNPSRTVKRAKSVSWAAALTAGLAIAMLAIPPLISWLTKSKRLQATIVHFIGLDARPSWSLLLWAGLATAVTVIGWFSYAGLARWNVLNGPVTSGGAAKTWPAWLTKFAKWLHLQLLPWVASTAIVLGGVVLALRWTSDGARAGFTADQLLPVAVALVVVLLTRVIVDVNGFSLHDFYRWRLTAAYAVTREAAEETAPARRQELFAKAAATRLSELENQGDPALVIATTANINVNREVPAHRGGFCLAFDQENVTLRSDPRCGEKDVKVATTDYEHLLGHTRFTLFDIVAISGAASSPLIGAATRGAYRLLLTLTNLRLGVWMPHPLVVSRARKYAEANRGHSPRAGRIWLLLLWYVLPHPFWRRNPGKQQERENELWAHVLTLREGSTEGKQRPSLILARLQAAVCWRMMQPTLGILWAEVTGRTSYRATWVNVTDGGLYDNLGLVEALRRCPGNLVILDASGNTAHEWPALSKAITLASADAGVEVKLDGTTVTGGGGDLCPGQVVHPWAQGQFRHLQGVSWPEQQGQIWVCKFGWWADGPWPLLSYARQHPAYLSDTTRERLHDAAEFDFYQQLGMATVLDAGPALQASLPASPSPQA
jgi:hypothetical protein